MLVKWPLRCACHRDTQAEHTVEYTSKMAAEESPRCGCSGLAPEKHAPTAFGMITAALENPNSVATAMLLDRRHTRGTSRLSDGVQKRLAAPEHLAEPCTENFCTQKKRLSTGEPS
ncbi:hypothetical protein NDU88_006522 [Pleurodeles waltl]|uniref:Uncharacterized protein n=1 Tax=Pleurodeles waltl TaxID=8319 RepID=A0AAV7TZR1_PLEWA|nr:hypothetical protein NDU88_006522 [Pleurodeles waltl]